MVQAQSLPQSSQLILQPGPYQPLALAALGPNYGKGEPYQPSWIPNWLNPGEVAVIPANYGQQGGSIGWQSRYLDIIGNPLEPARLTHKPQWNVLIPPVTFNLAVLTAQQLATFENAQNVQAPQIPMNFAPVGTASLMK